jgi:Putative peptidoglycan binding domain
MPSGNNMVALALTRVGQKYHNVCVPKNDPNWKGPWDCAEFMSWLVYQESGLLYGCVSKTGNPALVEAYTGAWQTDSRKRGIRVPIARAASLAGGILLRFPPAPGRMGHIAMSDGNGLAIEAHSTKEGVVHKFPLTGRHWDVGVLIPGFSYDDAEPHPITPPTFIYRIGAANMRASVVTKIQQALATKNISPGVIDGVFGGNTAASVAAFQAREGLLVDGQVGPATAKALGIKLD